MSPEVPRWARQELDKMGGVTRREVLMALLAALALALWVLGADWMNVTTSALLTFCLMLLTGVIRWDDVLGHGRAWNALTWFATLVTLADGLNRVGFLKWFAARTVEALGGLSVTTKIILIVVVFFVAHYMFASLTAHTTALLPVFVAAVVSTQDLPIKLTVLLLCYGLGLMGILTPYATGAAPIYYASGYVDRKAFWRLGLVFGALFLAALLALGMPYLSVLYAE